MWVILSVLIIIGIAVTIFVNRPSFGRTPRGERLERVKNSPHYSDGKFQNIHTTRAITSDRGYPGAISDFLFGKKERIYPETALPVIKEDLWKLNREDNLLVWFGHSSYLLQIDGVRILVDPVFYDASPVSFFNKYFKGTDVFRPEDIPEIDYLIISHDHWDHLDYKTVTALKDRIGKVICGLGVGEHFERWDFQKTAIVELDWNEDYTSGDGVIIHCLPARHFSGRGLPSNQSLWASFLIETKQRKVYIGGDSGYDTHYAEIGEKFGPIDLSILENGQYDKNWSQIHLLPEYHAQVFKELQAKSLFTVHHSKFALANHPWDEPLKKIVKTAERDSINLILPMIGEVVQLKDNLAYINRWWETVK